LITVRSSPAVGDDDVVFVMEGAAEPTEMRFRSATIPLRAHGDAALVAALPLAMRAGLPLHVDLAVSARLVSAVGTIQDVLAVWWRSSMSRVEVTTGRGAPPVGGDRHGGIVSDDLSSVHLAIAPGAPDLLFGVRAGRDAPAPPAAVPVVDTNLAEVGLAFGLDWEAHYRGAAVAAVAHLVPDIGRVDLPAPFSVHYLFPWGSHAVLDPLWSGDGLEVRHRHAESDWIQRLALVASRPEALARVRFCEHGGASTPCRACRGCLFMAAGLRVVGHPEPPPFDPAAFAALDLRHHTVLADAAVLLRHADRDRHPGLVDAVEAGVRALGPGDVEWPDNWFAYLAELGSARR
jgi:hypothetical protein